MSWIPITTSLPGIGLRVFVMTKGHEEPSFACLVINDDGGVSRFEWQIGGGYYSARQVTEWMPIPPRHTLGKLSGASFPENKNG